MIDDDGDRPLPPAVLSGLPVAVGRRQPVASRYRYELDPEPGSVGARIDGHSVLVPESDCRNAVTELTASLEPMDPEKAVDLAELLVNSYPQVQLKQLRAPDFYLRAIRTALERLPADIAAQTVDHLTLHLKWLPARADVWEIGSRMLEQRKRMLSYARRHLDEHQRRAGGAPQEEPARRYSDLSAEERAAHDANMEAIRSALSTATTAITKPTGGSRRTTPTGEPDGEDSRADAA